MEAPSVEAAAADAGPLRDLLRACFFRGEWLFAAGAAPDLLVQGRALSTQHQGWVGLVRGLGRLHCVRYSEAAFARSAVRASLPCGARSLFVYEDEEGRGRLFLRGMNKFCECGAEEGPDVLPYLLDPTVRRYVQPMAVRRKLAGFLCILAANPLHPEAQDPERFPGLTLGASPLLVASKHTLAEEEHVKRARAMLRGGEGEAAGARERALAGFLARHKAVLLCEAIEPDATPHPVREGAPLRGKLVAFALQRRDTVREEVLPDDLLQEAARLGGLPLAPAADPGRGCRCKEQPCKHQWAGFDAAVQKAAAWDVDGKLGEGWVATFAVPASAVRAALGCEHAAGAAPEGDPAVFRVKVKTLRYRTQRRLRELLKRCGRAGGSDVALVDTWRRAPTFARVLLAWAAIHEREALGLGAGWDGDVALLLERFEKWVAPGFLRGWRALRTWQGFCRSLRLSVSPQAHTLVYTVGLPGSGKTTLVQELLRRLQERSGAAVAYISRDEVTAAELRSRAAAEDAAVSAGARSVQRAVHRRIGRLLHLIRTSAQTPMIVIVDGCHLTAGARRQLDEQLGTQRPAVTLSLRPRGNIEEGSDGWGKLCNRIQQRGEHPTLAAAQAPEVLGKMIHRIEYPPAGGALVLEFDPFTMVPAAASNVAVKFVLAEHMCRNPAEQMPAPPVLDADALETALGAPADRSEELLSALGLSVPVPCRSLLLRSLTVAPVSRSAWAAAASGALAALARLASDEGGGDAGAAGGVGLPPQAAPAPQGMLWWGRGAAVSAASTLGRPVAGALHWLRGQLGKELQQLLRQPRSAADHLSADDANCALRRYYSVGERIGALHCTVAWLGGGLPPELSPAQHAATLRVLQDKEAWVGAECEIECDALLVDNKAVSLSVSRVVAWPRQRGWLRALRGRGEVELYNARGGAPATPPPAAAAAAAAAGDDDGDDSCSAAEGAPALTEQPHITLGVVAREAPRYCAAMRARFALWQQENEALDQERAAKRRRAAGAPPGQGAAPGAAGQAAPAAGYEEPPDGGRQSGAKRKRRQHAFAELPIAGPIVLRGVMHLPPMTR